MSDSVGRVDAFKGTFEEIDAWEDAKKVLKQLLADRNYEKLPPVLVACSGKEKAWGRASKLLVEHLEEDIGGKHVMHVPEFLRAVRVTTALLEHQQSADFAQKVKEFEAKIENGFGELVEKLADNLACEHLSSLFRMTQPWPKYHNILLNKTREQRIFIMPGANENVPPVVIAFRKKKWGGVEVLVCLGGADARPLDDMLSQWKKAAKVQTRNGDIEKYGKALQDAMRAVTGRTLKQEKLPGKILNAAREAEEKIGKRLKRYAEAKKQIDAAQPA